VKTLEALAVVRDALQPTADRPALISLAGRISGNHYAEKEMPLVEARARQDQLADPEIEEAVMLADYINVEIGQMVDIDRTVANSAWRDTEAPLVRCNLGRIGIACDRAARQEILPIHTVDMPDLIVRSAAELMVTGAMIGTVRIKGELSSMGVYSSPTEIAELWAGHPDLSPSYIKKVLHATRLTKRFLPDVLDAIECEGIASRDLLGWITRTLRRLEREEGARRQVASGA
jgi:hypothetical protein